MNNSSSLVEETYSLHLEIPLSQKDPQGGWSYEIRKNGTLFFHFIKDHSKEALRMYIDTTIRFIEEYSKSKIEDRVPLNKICICSLMILHLPQNVINVMQDMKSINYNDMPGYKVTAIVSNTPINDKQRKLTNLF